MSEPKFTPGPWAASGWGVYAAALEGTEYNVNGIVASIATGVENTLEAVSNAHLIAAAPEMYQALKEIRDMLWSRPDISERLRPLMGFAEEAINQKAAAALTKAEGGEA